MNSCDYKFSKPGREISIQKQFTWGEENWYVPVIRIRDDGVSADFFVQADTQRLKAFYEKARAMEERNEPLTEKETECLQEENPLSVTFRGELVFEGERFRQKERCSRVWVPSCIVGDDGGENPCVFKQLKRWGLDPHKAWSVHSCTFSGEAEAPQSLTLHLEREKRNIPGISFQAPPVGECVSFVHPVTGKEYRLTVQALKAQELSQEQLSEQGLIFPRHFVAMSYTIEPPLSEDDYIIKDCAQGDRPKRRPVRPEGSLATVSAVAAKSAKEAGDTRAAESTRAVRGAKKVRGVTAIAVISRDPGSAGSRTVCSGLHFEPLTEPVVWKLLFREKPIEDIDVILK